MRSAQAAPISFHKAFVVLGVAFFAVFSWVFLKEYLAEWRGLQSQFEKLERQVKDPHALSLAAPVGRIRQVWLQDLDRVDRCTTCHLGVDDPVFVRAPQPFATHGGSWLQTHPPDRYGCSVCHGGQGEATTYRDAGHVPIPDGPEPILPKELIEANCGACHRQREVQEALWLTFGREQIARAGCVACHDIPGFSREEVRAPRLDSVGYKLQRGWLQIWLANPRDYLSQARMPNFRLQPDEIESLTTFLLAQRSTPPLDSSGVDWAKADPDRGRVIFGEARCVSCHMIDGRGGTLGPELTDVGNKVRREWLFSFLKDPMRDQPATLMLRYRLADDDIRDLVGYLTGEPVDGEGSRTSSESRYLNPALVEKGRDAFVRHGCYSCHRLGGMSDLAKIGPSLVGIGDRPVESAEFKGRAVRPTLPNWLLLKLLEPDKLAEASRMPTYNFTEIQASAVVVALLSIRKSELPASRVTSAPRPEPYEPQGEFGALVKRYQCLSCHQVRGWGGTLSTVPLDRIGSQLLRPYLVSYLRKPVAVRVSVEERMPDFRMTDKEAQTLADYLSSVFVDDSLERPRHPDPELARQGEQLFATLGCRACHMVGGRGGYVGPDLSGTGRRLKPGWIEAWLSAPGKWKPGTLQPDYGLKTQEASALTAYLMTLSESGAGSKQ